MVRSSLLIFGLASLLCATHAVAQPPPLSVNEWRVWVPDPATLDTPELEFDESESDAEDFDKYFYFHREDTDFETALRDIRECDAQARGLWQASGSNEQTNDHNPYGLIGSAAQALIFGPAQERLSRRAILRRCMFRFGYLRFGIAKAQWETFNFQRITSHLGEREIQTMLAQQALVASENKPAGQELGL